MTEEQEKRRRGIKRRGRWHDRLLDRLNSPDPAYRQNVASVLAWSGYEFSNEGPEHEARLERLEEAIDWEPNIAVRLLMIVARLALAGEIEEADRLYERCVGFRIGDSLNSLN